MKKKIEYEGKTWTVVSDHTTATVTSTKVTGGVMKNRLLILEGTPDEVKKRITDLDSKNVKIHHAWNVKTIVRETLGKAGAPKDREVCALQAEGIDGEGKKYNPSDPDESVENKEQVEQVSMKEKAKKAGVFAKKWGLKTWALVCTAVVAFIAACIAIGMAIASKLR